MAEVVTEETEEEKPAKGNDELLAAARKFAQDVQKDRGEDWKAQKDDLEFLKGGDNQWGADELTMRRIDRRPVITVNKLPTFLHQVTNSLRMNRPGIKLHPVGGTADEETTKIRQGMIRHIEYDSNADVAYDRAVCSAAAIGVGYLRLITDYCDEMSFDQEIKFCSVRNPFTVLFDWRSTEPDGSDAKEVMVVERMDKEAFKAQWPDAEAASVTNVTPELDYWINNDQVLVADWYRIEETPAQLCMLADGQVAWKDELPPGAVVTAERKSMKRKVMLRKISGCDVLEETEIKCHWIPVFPVYGDEIDVDGKVTRLGLIRNAKDPAMTYNYWITSATEEVALRPKAPFLGAVGAFENLEKDWAMANRRSFPFLQYNPIVVDGVAAPPPQRQPMADMPAGNLQMAMHANDNIKATTGLFDASLGARGTATSGVQEREQQRQGDIANFHFVDSLNRTIRHVGRCINSMIPHYYDTERVVKIMGLDDEVSHETINQPVYNPLTGAIDRVLNDMKGGEYDVTVTAGASYTTMRAEAVDKMTELASRDPNFLSIAGDLYFGEMDWPGADKLSDRYKKIIDPKLLEDEENADAGMKAAKLQQQAQILEQQGMELQQRMQLLQQAEQQIQEAGNATKEEMAKIEAARADLRTEMARLDTKKAEVRTAMVELELAEERAVQRVREAATPEMPEEKPESPEIEFEIEAPQGG